MGIKNIHNLLRKMCPHVYNKVSLTRYAFKKIAIDLSLFMCKYKTSFGLNWLDAFLQMISILRYNDIHFIIVYDNKAPPEKDNERRLRSESRAKSRERVENLQKAWDEIKPLFSDSNDIDYDLTKHNVLLHGFLTKLADTSDDRPTISKVDNELLKMRQSLLSIRSEDFEMTKELFTLCGIPIMMAEGEAEATCAALNKQGYVSAVLSDDTDVLAYGAPIMLSKLDFQSNTCIELDYKEILEELKLTSAQFLDLCIMCGTDYNTNIPKIGCDRSYKLISQYSSLENMRFHMPSLDYTLLNFVRVRELFTYEPVFENEVSFCDFPREKELFEFCFMHNCHYDPHLVIKSCTVSQFHQFDIENETTEKEKNKNLLLTIIK